MTLVAAPDPAASPARVAPRPVLAGRGLVKRFGRTEALRGVDLSLAPGEVLAIVGPSGSGKSTLLHVLAGVIAPDAGEVLLDGARIDGLGEAERSVLRRTAFGFVFQFGQLVPELTAAENVALPLLLGGCQRRPARERAVGWLDRLGLEGLSERRPGELSGGEGQRVAIARALVAEPRVVFADEPTGSLDSLSGEHVMNVLTDAVRGSGTSVVLVTHEARVAAYADREVVVRDGRISGPSDR